MNSSTEKYSFLLDLLKKVSSAETDKAVLIFLNALSKEYSFDKATSFFNHVEEHKFKTLHTCVFDNLTNTYEVVSHKDINTNINDYTILLSKRDIKRDKAILDLFSNRNYIYTRKPKILSQSLDILNFNCDTDKIQELFIYPLIDNSDNLNDVFGYFALERYTDNYLSEQDISDILILFNFIETRIKDYEKIKTVNKKNQITQALAETTQLDKYLIVVKKETFEILHCNNTMTETIGKNALNEICYKFMFDRKEPCPHCPIIKNQLNDTVFTTIEELDYLIRVSEINWRNKNDAYVMSMVDVSKFIASKLSKDSLTDSLTWLGLKEKIKSEYDKNTKYAYISLDVDGIKLINDVHTKIVGNEILKQITLVLKKVVKNGEYYCRVVADEFALILKYVDSDELNLRMKRVELALSRMFAEIFEGINIVVSGGIYIIEADLLANLDTAFENSRLARNTAKGVYKHNFALYNEDIRDDLKNTRYIEDKVELALANDEFVVYLQPKFNISTNTIVGAEALVRWETGNEMIFPDTFIPIFEKNGFILTLDFIIYNKVFGFMRECLDEERSMVPISINASRKHLSDSDFLDRLLILIQLYDIPKQFIEVEITENASEGSDDKLHDFVKSLKEEGLKVSMDDFGSAYSSLNLLKTLDIDTLKLDKAFLDKMGSEQVVDALSKDEIIVKNIVNMANELKFNVLCEGIETTEQGEFLKNISCNYGQGYIFSKPLPLQEFKEKYL